MLDIIIPTYNDIIGLQRSIQSVLFFDLTEINITVVNDASTINYNEIYKKYPQIQFLNLVQNCGPGAARNYARKHTYNPYIMFLDCGDIIYSKYSLLEILDTIKNEPNFSVYAWQWVDDEYNLIKSNKDPSTPGRVYNRQFLESHNLWQCEGKGSYAGEDLSFNRACYAIAGDKGYKYMNTPIYSTITNNNSLTHKNNKEFMYKQTPGFIENMSHCMNLCEQNMVDIEICDEIINDLIVMLYHQFLLGLDKAPDDVFLWWPAAHKFYINYYQKYESYKYNDEQLGLAQGGRMKGLLSVNKTGKIINTRRFIRELANNNTVPPYYLEGV